MIDFEVINCLWIVVGFWVLRKWKLLTRDESLGSDVVTIVLLFKVLWIFEMIIFLSTV